MDRIEAIRLRNEISSYKPGTRYEIKEGKIYITVEGGLTPEQRELAMAHKPILMELFTTPPDVVARCYHGEQSIWRLNENGVWICPCFHLSSQPSQQILFGNNPPAASKSTTLVKNRLIRAS